MWVESVKDRTYRKEEAMIYSGSGMCQSQEVIEDIRLCGLIVAYQYAHAANDQNNWFTTQLLKLFVTLKKLDEVFYEISFSKAVNK